MRDKQADIGGCGRLWTKAESCVMLETRDGGHSARSTCNDSLPMTNIPGDALVIYTDCCSASRREYVYGLCREPGAREVDFGRPSKLNATREIKRKSVCSSVER